MAKRLHFQSSNEEPQKLVLPLERCQEDTILIEMLAADLKVVVEVNVDDEPLPAAGEHLQRVGDQGTNRLCQNRPEKKIKVP